MRRGPWQARLGLASGPRSRTAGPRSGLVWTLRARPPPPPPHRPDTWPPPPAASSGSDLRSAAISFFLWGRGQEPRWPSLCCGWGSSAQAPQRPAPSPFQAAPRDKDCGLNWVTTINTNSASCPQTYVTADTGSGKSSSMAGPVSRPRPRPSARTKGQCRPRGLRWAFTPPCRCSWEWRSCLCVQLPTLLGRPGAEPDGQQGLHLLLGQHPHVPGTRALLCPPCHPGESGPPRFCPSRTSECDLIWKKGLCRCNKSRS